MKVGIDGGCEPNPGPGAWAVVFEDGKRDSGFEPDTTNNRMELTAAIHALALPEDEIEIVTDSRYVEGLLAKGWKPKTNHDLVDRMRSLAVRKKRVTVRWVRGHTGEPLNTAADELCTETLRAYATDDFTELAAAFDRWA